MVHTKTAICFRRPQKPFLQLQLQIIGFLSFKSIFNQNAIFSDTSMETLSDVSTENVDGLEAEKD